MADEIARKMMADLGVGRRDQVTAPDEKKRTNNPHDIAARAREQAEVNRTVTAHRARVAKAAVAGKGEDDRTTRIKKWSDQTVFDKDEITDQLQNRFEGQGHRAGLKRRFGGYDQHQEAAENTRGEERTMWLKQQGRELNNANGDVTKQTKFQKQSPGGESSRQPKASSTSTPNRGRGRLVAEPNQNKAPSPKGRTRFVRDQKVGQNASTQPAINGAGTPAKSVPQTTTVPSGTPQANSVTPVVTEAPQVARQSTAIPVRTPSPSRSHASSSSRRTGGPRAPHQRPMTRNTLPAQPNPAVVGVYRTQALWYAARPGLESDVYHEKFPERRQYLEWAMNTLLAEIMRLLKNSDERDVEIYIETHQERLWMVEAAKVARDLIERGTGEDIKNHCISHPTHEAFLAAAASYLIPNQRRDSGVTAPGADASAVAEDTAMPDLPQESISTTNDVAAVEVHTTAAENEATEIADNAAAPAPASESRAAMTGNSDLSSSSPLPATNGEVNGLHSSDSEDEAKDSSTTSVEVEVAVEPPQMQGRLTATFYDDTGMFVGIHQRDVRAPVMATMNFASRSPSYNPQELIAAIDRLAESMIAAVNTNGNGTPAANHLVTYDDSDEEL